MQGELQQIQPNHHSVAQRTQKVQGSPFHQKSDTKRSNGRLWATELGVGGLCSSQSVSQPTWLKSEDLQGRGLSPGTDPIFSDQTKLASPIFPGHGWKSDVLPFSCDSHGVFGTLQSGLLWPFPPKASTRALKTGPWLPSPFRMLPGEPTWYQKQGTGKEVVSTLKHFQPWLMPKRWITYLVRPRPNFNLASLRGYELVFVYPLTTRNRFVSG